MSVAIVTGAASGIGIEYTKAIVERYSDVDELWLVDINGTQLEEVSKNYTGKKIKNIVLDLSKDESYQEYQKILEENKPDVKILVSNAGLLTYGHVTAVSLERQLKLVDVNAKATLAITKITIPYIHKRGKIIITSSASAYLPSLNYAVYAATKAFSLSYARTLRAELQRNEKVNVLAVCPGTMKTPMVDNQQEVTRTKVGKIPVMDPAVIARHALVLSDMDWDVYTPGFFYKMYRLGAKFLPKELLIRMTSADD